MAKCPSCRGEISWDAANCPKCQADFSQPDAWRPVADTREEAALLADKYPGYVSPPPEEIEHKEWPFSGWWPVLAGVLTGLVLRLIFSGKPGGPFAAMMASFIVLCPMIVGAVTVYCAELEHRRSWGYYFTVPLLANILFVLGTLAILIEGLICVVVIMPLFAMLGGVGGLIMGGICRARNWPRRKTLYGFAMLPLVLGGLEGNIETPSKFGSVERTVVIRAAPEIVWRQIMHASEIKPDEMEQAWIFRIGVPLPIAGVVEHSPEGKVRRIRMGKDVHYDQVFTEERENRYVHWTYRLYPDSFPPYALDDHVLVGGYYFDVKDTSYTLTPAGEGTALKINMGYRVTTQFNWYSEPLAHLLLGNFEEIVLKFYRQRSETVAGRGTP